MSEQKPAQRVTFVLQGPKLYCARCDAKTDMSNDKPLTIDAFVLMALTFARIHEGMECPAYD